MFSPKIFVLITFVIALFFAIWGAELIMWIITPIMGDEKAAESSLPGLSYLIPVAWVVYFCIYLYQKMWGRSFFGKNLKKPKTE